MRRVEAASPKAPARVVVVNDFGVPRGGATVLAVASAKGLRQRGLPVTFFCGDAGDNSDLASAGVEIVAMGSVRLLDSQPTDAAIRGLYNAFAAQQLAAWIEQHDTPGTVYHLHVWMQILSPSIFTALERVADRLFISAHDFFLVCPNGAYALFGTGEPCTLVPLGARCIATNCDRRNYAHKLWRAGRQAIQTRTLRFRSDRPRVLAIHAGMRPALVRGGVPDKAISVVPNPIEPWSVTRIPAEENRVLLFVGRLEAEKGPDLAARAARRAGVPLRIVGDGPMLSRLQQEFPEVMFSGRQPPQEVARIARSARALVMPSRYPEPFGLVAGEALWSGLPVIVPSTALIAAEVVAGDAGLACDPRDEAALANAMAAIAGDAGLTRRLSLNAIARMRHLGQTPDDWIDALLDAYGGQPETPHRAADPAPLGSSLPC